MAIRCDGCDGKFGSNGEPEVEVESSDITDTTVTAEVTVKVPCGNCGTEDFKTGSLSFEQEIDTSAHDSECAFEVDGEDGVPITVTFDSDQERFEELAEERTFTIDDVDAQVGDDYEPKPKLVKSRKTGEMVLKHTPARYQRHLYLVTLTVSLTCDTCGGALEAVLEDSLGAGELEAGG